MKIVLALGGLLKEVEQITAQTEGMENWDAKYLIEISLSMIATSYDINYDSNKIVKRIYDRIGLLDINSVSKPEIVFLLISKITSRIYSNLYSNELNGIDLRFEGWLGDDIVINYIKDSSIYSNSISLS